MNLENLILDRWAYVLTVTMLIIGLYGMLLKRNLIKKLIGMNIFQGAIILFYVAYAYKQGATVPVFHKYLGEHPHAADYMNPIPHGLMLTAIVVSVATTGVALALLIAIYRNFGTLEEGELLEKLRRDG